MVASTPKRRRRRGIAVTGAYSYVGVELLKRLEADARWDRLLAIDIREPEGLQRTTFHRVDLTMPNAGALCAEILAKAEIDTFVHAAFLSGPTHNRSWAHELEVIGTVHVLDACAQAGIRKFIHWSTTGVYGPHPLNPNFLSEAHELRGLRESRYFRDRVEAEKEVTRFAAENPKTIVTVLRTAHILGSDINNYATRFFRRPVLPVLMGFDPLVQFVHPEDAVQAFVLACHGEFRGAFNIVGDGVLPYTTVVARLGRVAVPVPHVIAYQVARLLWATQVMESPSTFLHWLRFLCVADGRKAKQKMGFAPTWDIRAIVDDFLGLPTGIVNEERP